VRGALSYGAHIGRKDLYRSGFRSFPVQQQVVSRRRPSEQTGWIYKCPVANSRCDRRPGTVGSTDRAKNGRSPTKRATPGRCPRETRHGGVRS
jgi:hypothetical protein